MSRLSRTVSAAPSCTRRVAVERGNGGVSLRCQRDGGEFQLSARVVLGADGAHSRVARSMGLSPPRERVYCLGLAGRLTAAGLRGYERAVKAEIGRELRRSLRIRRFGLSLSDGDVDRLVSSLGHEALQPLITRLGDIDYPSRVLLRLARTLPALWPLVRLSLRPPLASLHLLRAFLPGG